MVCIHPIPALVLKDLSDRENFIEKFRRDCNLNKCNT